MQTMRRATRRRRCFVRQTAGRRVNSRRGSPANNVRGARSVDQSGPTAGLRHNEATPPAVTMTVLPFWAFRRRFMAVIVLWVTVTAARGDERVLGTPARRLGVRMMPTTPYRKMVEHDGHHQVVQGLLHSAVSSAES